MKNDTIMPQIAQKLHQLRVDRGLSMADIARMTGISRKQVQNYERAACEIPLLRLWHIGRSCGVDLIYFLSDISEPEFEPLITPTEQKLLRAFNYIDDDLQANLLNLIYELQPPTA